MWNKIRKLAQPHKTVVLSARDIDGIPSSVRARPFYNDTDQTITLELSAPANIKPGSASVLYHCHNEAMSKTYTYIVRGNLAQINDAWIFSPIALVPGNIGTAINAIKAIVNARARKKYREQRQQEQLAVYDLAETR